MTPQLYLCEHYIFRELSKACTAFLFNLIQLNTRVSIYMENIVVYKNKQNYKGLSKIKCPRTKCPGTELSMDKIVQGQNIQEQSVHGKMGFHISSLSDPGIFHGQSSKPPRSSEFV